MWNTDWDISALLFFLVEVLIGRASWDLCTSIHSLDQVFFGLTSRNLLALFFIFVEIFAFLACRGDRKSVV